MDKKDNYIMLWQRVFCSIPLAAVSQHNTNKQRNRHTKKKSNVGRPHFRKLTTQAQVDGQVKNKFLF
jgi:hypothetical protein